MDTKDEKISLGFWIFIAILASWAVPMIIPMIKWYFILYGKFLKYIWIEFF